MKPGLQFGKANRKMMRTHGCRRALASGDPPTALLYNGNALLYNGAFILFTNS
jgi:hypothetical protein